MARGSKSGYLGWMIAKPIARALVLSGGGPLAVAWECGILAGLSKSGVALADADFILGTSAGAIVGAQFAAGRDPTAMADAILGERSGTPPPGAMLDYPADAIMKLPELFARAQRDDAGRAEVGAYALAAPMRETEPAYVARMRLVVGADAWPERLGVVAVDVADGQAQVLRSDSHASLAAAVAASCCLPGLSPPVAINGRRYMDGGTRSSANADLASGFDDILVLGFRLAGPAGDRMSARVALQSEQLETGGARVSVLAPDEPALAEIGSRTMDVVRRPAVVQAAIAQGTAMADSVARRWLR